MKFIQRIGEGERYDAAFIGWKWFRNWHGFHFGIALFGLFALKITRWDGHWFFEPRHIKYD